MVHPEPPGRGEGREHGLVRIVLAFRAVYLETRFGKELVASRRSSRSPCTAANWTVPRQLVVRSPKARNKVTKLPHGTSLLDLRAACQSPLTGRKKRGCGIFSLESALIECSPQYFSSHATDARAAWRWSAMLPACWRDYWKAATARSPAAWPAPSATADATASRTKL